MSNVPVDPIVEMLIDGAWTDITADCRLNSADSGGGLSITRGVPNEGGAAEPTQFDFVLNNREGNYTPLNPNGPYYGLLGRNQPVRVGLSRVLDEFDRDDLLHGLGFTPDKDLGNDLIKSGFEWRALGAADKWQISSNQVVCAAASGTSAMVFGTYADIDVKVRVKTSDLTSQFGIIFRNADFDVSVLSPYFEGGVSGWNATGGSISQTTALLWNDRASAVLLVSGSPSTSYVRPGSTGAVPVEEGSTYRAVMRVRSPTTPSVLAAIDWYDAGSNYLSTSVGSVSVLTADTWTYIEAQDVAPAGAAFAGYGPTLTSSPANGTQLVINDIRLHDYTNLEWYAARANPTVSPNRIQISKVVPGTSVAFGEDISVAADTWYWIQLQSRGQNMRTRFWEDGTDPPDWQLTRHDGEDYLDAGVPPRAGAVGFYVFGGSATVTFDSIQVDQWRAHTEIAELPPRYDLSRQDRWVPIQSRGILRRLGQGRKALEPPVTLHLESYAPLTVGWWPLEAGSESRSPNRVTGRIVGGGRPALITGISFGADDTLPGVAAVASVSSDTMRVSMRAGSVGNTGAWTHLMYLKWDQAPASSTMLASVQCAGTGTQWRIWASTGGAISVEVLQSDGTVLDGSGDFGLYGSVADYGDWVATTIYVFQDGSNIKWAFNYHIPGSEDFWTTGTRTVAGSVGRYLGTEIYGTANHNSMGFKFTHVLGYAGDLPFVTSDFALAARAYAGELMLTRFRRLCENAGIPYLVYGLNSGDEEMGPQLPAKVLDLLEECAQVGDAILEEDRDNFALVMRTRKSMYVQEPVELDLDEGHISAPSEPVADDQLTRNDVTISRPGGSSARSIQETGPLNIQDPEDDPDGVGVYDTAAERNVERDDQLPPIANWHRHKGTQQDPRYPAIAADLTSSTYLVDAALSAAVASIDLGDLLRVANTEVSPDPTDQIVKQTVEKIDQYEWSRQFVATPGRIYRVGLLGYSTRLDTSNFVTEAEFVSGTDTSLSIERVDTAGKRWVRPEDQAIAFPMDVIVSGVRLTVTDVDGTTDPQTMTVEQTPVNGVIKTIPAGTPVRVYEPWILAW